MPLCVLRFTSTGPRQYSQLAMCIAVADEHVQVIKTNETVFVHKAEVCMAERVDLVTLEKKAHVLEAARRDCAALRLLVPMGYEQVSHSLCPRIGLGNAYCVMLTVLCATQEFDSLDADLETMRARDAPIARPRHSTMLMPKHGLNAESMLNDFVGECDLYQDDPIGIMRIEKMKEDLEPFRQCSQSLMPTSYIDKPLHIAGMQDSLRCLRHLLRLRLARPLRCPFTATARA